MWLLKGKPWEVQTEALKRSDAHDRYGWFLEQGLGKTPLTLNDFYSRACRGEVDGCVVFTPQTYKGDWVNAPEDWGISEWVKSGAWPRTKPGRFTNEQSFLYAMNYEAVRTSGGKELYDLLARRRCMLVIDESSAIKNPRSQQAKAVLDLAKDAKMVRELNGTPQVQNVMDWFAQLKVLGELNGVNPFAFRNHFAVMGGYMGKQVLRNQLRHADELYAIIDRCGFRALKKDWRKDLPERIFKVMPLEMTDKQRMHYEQMMEEFYTCVCGDHVTADMVLTQYEKLRQISSCLVLTDGRAHWIEEPGGNPKVRALLDVIEGGGGKVIVVHFYRETGHMLTSVLGEHGLQPAHIRGGMKPDEVVEQKRRFNDDPNCRVLVGQIQSAHLGHTLIGQPGDRASRMFFFENSFRLLHRLQMLDRNHRGDMDETCVVFDPVTSPMDRLLLENLGEKKEAADAIDRVIAAVKAHKWKKAA